MTNSIQYKYFIFLLLSVIILHGISAQEKPDMDHCKWNLKIGYSRINNWSMSSGNIGEFTFETNYRLKKYLDVGVYAGWALTKTEMREENFGSFENDDVLSYGINTYLRLIPLITGKESRFGVSLIIKPGGYYIFAEKNYHPQGHHFTFRPGIGIDYRIFRKAGVFAEYLYGLGDGKYRVIKGWPDDELGYKNHIGSFRFGVAFYW